MRLALLAIAAAAMLAGCDEVADQAGEAEAATGPTGTIDCSLNGAGGFGRDCTMERAQQDGENFIIIRHPDGAFRRFQLGVPGAGLVTADGAEQAEVTDMGGYVEVRVGSDRYHLPISE